MFVCVLLLGDHGRVRLIYRTDYHFSGGGKKVYS